MPQHVIVTDYSKAWPAMFEEEAKLIREILSDNCLAIYHIGSTSVPGLKATPVIDIMPVVEGLSRVDADASEFEKIGYEYLGEFGISGRRYLRKGGDERTHQIHIFSLYSQHDVTRHLAVRDYLRAHKKEADEYGRLKQSLALKYPYDIESYCDGKNDFVQNLERKALLWANAQKQR